MNKKIMCIGIIGMFLTVGLATTYAAAEKIESSNQNSTNFLIKVGCGYDKNYIGAYPPFIPPNGIDTTITITNTETDETISLTNPDNYDNIKGYQYFNVKLVEEESYHIVCSIKLPGHWKPMQGSVEKNVNIVYPYETSFWFKAEYKIIKPKSADLSNVLSKILYQFPILQQLLKI